MKLNSGEFETEIDSGGGFAINICQESYSSTRYITNTFYIDRDDAKLLIEELQRYTGERICNQESCNNEVDWVDEPEDLRSQCISLMVENYRKFLIEENKDLV